MDIFAQPLVFVDIETNGLSPVVGRIIEVAAIRVERGKIVDSFNQIINPEVALPSFTTQLTGISDQDTRKAPRFIEVSEELHAVMNGAFFVAHNARFDYSFLNQEFMRVGREFAPRQICTVKLSRALYPEHKSHKLENLIDRHNLTFTNRHRAYDDAHALWQFLQIIGNTFEPGVIAAALAKQLK